MNEDTYIVHIKQNNQLKYDIERFTIEAKKKGYWKVGIYLETGEHIVTVDFSKSTKDGYTNWLTDKDITYEGGRLRIKCRPDLILVNPYSIDYPLWRETMAKHQAKFRKIINGFYQDYRRHDFKDFIVENTPWAISVDAGNIEGDWRNWTVNKCLPLVTSDWVLFLEQDFVATDEFWEKILEDANDYDVVGFTDVSNGGASSLQDSPEWQVGVRLHPAFILVRRELIDQTQKDFGAHPENNLDHFGTFTDDLRKLNPRFLNLFKYEGWKHYAGVYGNYMAVLAGNRPFFNVEDFKEFVQMSIEAKVKQDPRFIEWSNACF